MQKDIIELRQKIEKIVSEIGSPILFPLGVIQILFLLIFFSSPFILKYKIQ